MIFDAEGGSPKDHTLAISLTLNVVEIDSSLDDIHLWHPSLKVESGISNFVILLKKRSFLTWNFVTSLKCGGSENLIFDERYKYRLKKSTTIKKLNLSSIKLNSLNC